MKTEFIFDDQGVRAKLVDKDNSPKWEHKSLQDVSESDVLEIFKPFEDSKQELIL